VVQSANQVVHCTLRLSCNAHCTAVDSRPTWTQFAAVIDLCMRWWLPHLCLPLGLPAEECYWGHGLQLSGLSCLQMVAGRPGAHSSKPQVTRPLQVCGQQSLHPLKCLVSFGPVIRWRYYQCGCKPSLGFSSCTTQAAAMVSESTAACAVQHDGSSHATSC